MKRHLVCLICAALLAPALFAGPEAAARKTAMTAPEAIKLKIDHVTIAGPDLAVMERAFADIGWATDYGGPHSNGITHMALLGFDDGSYIELVSTLKPGQKSPLWGEAIAQNAGPCAWAVEAADVKNEAERLRKAGIKVEGPIHMMRRRPDGFLIEWDLAFVGEGPPGSTLPFIIKDRTPRQLRVQPSKSVAARDAIGNQRIDRLTGVALVVIGVKDLQAVAADFQKAYDWPAPAIHEDAAWGARLAHFEGTPVVLASPLAEDNWLGQRLKRFGDGPAAFLLSAVSLDTLAARLKARPPSPWLGRRVAWLDEKRLNGARLGLIE